MYVYNIIGAELEWNRRDERRDYSSLQSSLHHFNSCLSHRVLTYPPREKHIQPLKISFPLSAIVCPCQDRKIQILHTTTMYDPIYAQLYFKDCVLYYAFWGYNHFDSCLRAMFDRIWGNRLFLFSRSYFMIEFLIF